MKISVFSGGGAGIRCRLANTTGLCTQLDKGVHGVKKTRVIRRREVLFRCYCGDSCDQSRN